MEKDIRLKNIKAFLIENYKWIIFSICIISLIFLIKNIIDKDIKILDEAVYAVVSKYLISDNVTPFVKFITNFASPYWFTIFSILLFITIKNRKIGICIVINLGLSAALNFIVKNIMRRPRPEEYRLIPESGYSFPSGHSMVSLAFYGFLIYLIHKNIKNEALKVILILALTILIISIGISRIYLGVHYTSDVLAGFLTAIVYLIIYVHVIKNIKMENNNFS